MGFARSGRIVVIAGAVIATIGAAVVLTSTIQDGAGIVHPAAAAVSAVPGPGGAPGAVQTPVSTRPRPAAPLPSSAGVQVTVPALTEASPTEPLATLSVSTTTQHPPTAAAPTAPPATRPTASATTVVPPEATAPTTSASPRPTQSTPPAISTLPSSPTPTPTSSPAAAVPAQYAHLLGWVGGGRVVSLTFDDGPSRYTGQILDVLARYGIKATFCQIGDQVGAYPAIEARIRAEGHTFCDHSWDHDEALPSRSVAVIDSEISRTQQAIEVVTGVTPRYYRAPGGDWGRTNRLRLELARFHTVPLAWADDSLDWTKPGVAAIVHTVLSTVSPGAIVLLHDGGGNRTQTIAALPKIITGLRAAGYHFVVLPPNPTP